MIIFDVGANNGDSCVKYCEDPNNTVYAFEPTPYLIKNALQPKADYFKNFIIVPKAIGKACQNVVFNLAGHHNWGCSSIYSFNTNLQETWPGREDFYFNDKIEVEMITMKLFLEQNPEIQNIDFFHCDTQGNDIEVLEGFENHISKVKTGQIEVSGKNPLYVSSRNTLENAKQFLEANNFEIYELCNDDPLGNEINVRFRRKN
jgi:FkbM family methyltransferase